MSPLNEQSHTFSPKQVTATLSNGPGLQTRWSQPTDVFSVLLILGGDIVHRALAQLVGTGIAPVTFSFGWVSYAISLLYTSVSNATLMPPGSECSVLVFTAKNGYVRANSSWVISRLLRDLEYWVDGEVHRKMTAIMRDRHNYMKSHAKTGTSIPMPKKSGLCISIYEPSKTNKAGVPSRDMVYWSGFVVAIIQLVVAAIPILTDREWSVMVITGVGTVLAFLTGALPHWKFEKWYGRRDSRNTYILTRGNGAQHALMILGNEHGLNLEDLAAGAENLDSATADWTVRIYCFILGCFWIALLIGAAELSEPSWYLPGVGGIGMLQNLLVAGWRRKPSAMGIHLEFRKVIANMSTMVALLELEREYSDAGRCLLRTFFPGPLFADEEEKWRALAVKDSSAPVGQNNQNAQVEPLLRQPDQFESWAQHGRSFEKRS